MKNSWFLPWVITCMIINAKTAAFSGHGLRNHFLHPSDHEQVGTLCGKNDHLHPMTFPGGINRQELPRTRTMALKAIRSPFSLILPAGLGSIFGGIAWRLLAKKQKAHNEIFVPDSDVPYPLPVGSIHCPIKQLLGMSNGVIEDPTRISSPRFGPGLFFYSTARRLGFPRIFKFASASKDAKPTVVVSGYDNAKKVLMQEFQAVESYVVPFASEVTGTNSLRTCRDRRQHKQLRKLVGVAVSPKAISVAIPSLQAVANALISEQEEQQPLVTKHASNDEKLMMTRTKITTKPSSDVSRTEGYDESRVIRGEDMCNDFALEVARSQIIGLDDGTYIVDNGDEAHRPLTRTVISDWMGGIWSRDMTKAKEARGFVVRKIEDRIRQLQALGPDGSTLSGLVFATEEDDEEESESRHGKKEIRALSKDEIVDNVLLLVLAGTQTTAGTLTLALFLLGLHPEVFERVVLEQKQLVEQNGEALSIEQLENDCPYLDSVIREALRLRPVVGGSLRGTKETIVVDERQIPAGWAIAYDRHLTHFLDPTTREKDGSHMDVRKGFVPERWLDQETRPSQDFIPFGIGPRYCVGADFAMVEMKVFVATLARRITKFELLEPSPSSGDIVWRQKCILPVPEGGVLIRRTG